MTETNTSQVKKTEEQSNALKKGVIIVGSCGGNDYFGPLVIVAVYASVESLKWLKTYPFDMSNPLDDMKRNEIVSQVQSRCPFHPVIITPAKYNALFHDMPSVKEITAWAYASAISSLLEQVDCEHAICNGFEKDDVILQNYLNMKRNIVQFQVNKKNSLAVTSAGIWAEKTYIPCLRNLQRKYHTQLPRGVGDDVVEPANHILENYGWDGLRNTAKLHMKDMKDIDAVEPSKQTEEQSSNILPWE